MSAALAQGFADPVFDAQAAFKAAMWALARPGLPQTVAPVGAPPAALDGAAAALALALLDFETTVWLDATLSSQPALLQWLRFHTGVRITDKRQEAAFALFTKADPLPDFTSFAQGSETYPDRSTTLILPVRSFGKGRSYRLAGPGIDGMLDLAIDGAGEALADAMQTNRAAFPRGVDVLLVCGDQVVGLPRTVRLEEQKG